MIGALIALSGFIHPNSGELQGIPGYIFPKQVIERSDHQYFDASMGAVLGLGEYVVVENLNHQQNPVSAIAHKPKIIGSNTKPVNRRQLAGTERNGGAPFNVVAYSDCLRIKWPWQNEELPSNAYIYRWRPPAIVQAYIKEEIWPNAVALGVNFVIGARINISHEQPSAISIERLPSKVSSLRGVTCRIRRFIQRFSEKEHANAGEHGDQYSPPRHSLLGAQIILRKTIFLIGLLCGTFAGAIITRRYARRFIDSERNLAVSLANYTAFIGGCCLFALCSAFAARLILS